MLGKGHVPGAASSVIYQPSGEPASNAEDKCRVFLDHFDLTSQINVNSDTLLEMEIQESLDLASDNPINGDLIAAELELFLRHQKSKAVGLDLVHNEMLFRLSTENR